MTTLRAGFRKLKRVYPSNGSGPSTNIDSPCEGCYNNGPEHAFCTTKNL